MKLVSIGVCLVVLVAGCAPREQAGNAAPGDGFTLRGQVPIATPPGTRDANEKVRREAAARCPDGFVIRSMQTRPPANPNLVNRTIDYDAVVACTKS